MQGHSSCRDSKSRDFARASYWLTCLALTLAISASQAQAQLSRNGGGRGTIEGSVLIDGATPPAAQIRVQVRALTGGDIATTFTDSTGRFQAPTSAGSVLVTVQEAGYEPVEQRVDVSRDGGASGLLITLRKLKAGLVDRVSMADPAGYTVSVQDLKVPGKARHDFEKGLARLQKKDAEGSLSYFKEATNVFPNYSEAYYQIGLANLELRRGDDAEQALQRAIDLSGGRHAEAQVALGALLCDRQSYLDAERVLRRAIEVDGNSWKGHLFLGQALFGQNRLQEAENSAREVLLRRPDVSSAYILLANIHIRRHEYILGIQDLDTYLSMRPNGSNSQQAREVRAAAQKVLDRLQNVPAAPKFHY
jgi:tetratricopeptide (TPR) repeat protein